MHLETILIIVLIFALQACSNDSGQQKAELTEKSNRELESCYAFIKNNDSILMDLKVNGNVVSGRLTYNFYEKDDNEGTFVGEVHGDTIFAMYNFDSEGTKSTREIAFLKRENKIVEGFGEIEEKDGKATFKNRKFLNFDSNIILNKRDCF